MTEAFKAGYESVMRKLAQTNETATATVQQPAEDAQPRGTLASVLTPEFFEALGQQESNNNDAATNARESAVGRYQIRPGYLADANAYAGTSYALEDMRNPEIARTVISNYLARYSPGYTRRTGNPLTQEAAARIHNGGPRGAERNATTNYWNSVSNILSGAAAGN